MKLEDKPCNACVTAAGRAYHPIYRAACRGCAVRALASGPLFYRGGLDGGDAKPYRKALGLIFGDQWREGHARVLAEADRIQAAKLEEKTE